MYCLSFDGKMCLLDEKNAAFVVLHLMRDKHFANKHGLRIYGWLKSIFGRNEVEKKMQCQLACKCMGTSTNNIDNCVTHYSMRCPIYVH